MRIADGVHVRRGAASRIVARAYEARPGIIGGQDQGAYGPGAMGGYAQGQGGYSSGMMRGQGPAQGRGQGAYGSGMMGGYGAGWMGGYGGLAVLILLVTGSPAWWHG